MYSGLDFKKPTVVASSRFCTNPEIQSVWISGWKGRRDVIDGRGRQKKRVMAGHQRVKAKLRRCMKRIKHEEMLGENTPHI